MTSNNLKICVVVAQYYEKIASDLLAGAKTVLDKHRKFKPTNVSNKFATDVNFDQVPDGLEYKQIFVPGAFEIPGMIARFMDKYHAFIALGCVIKGETPHFDFISKAAINGIMNLSVQFKKPILNGIITCINEKQALERADPNKKNKGGEAASALIKILGIAENK